MSRFAVGMAAVLALWAGAASATTNSAYDAQLDSILHARDPISESLFEAATAARDSAQWDVSRKGFLEVTRRLPDFWPAYRRAAGADFRLGNRRSALEQMHWLIERDSSVNTLSALAMYLVETGSDVPPTPAESAEARQLLQRAYEQAPDDPEVARAGYAVGWASDDTALVRRSVQTLVVRDPEEWSTWVCLGSYEVLLNHEERARHAVARATQLGAPREARDQMAAWLDALARERQRRGWFLAALWALPAWFAFFGLLMLVGAWLSRTTLAAADRALEDPTGRAVGLDAWLRRAYAGVIAWSCAFFYISIPLVLLVVLAVGGGLLYGMLAVGHMPIKLILIVAALTLMTLWSVIRGLFARGGSGDPGPELDTAEQPRLRACLDEVAARVGTRAVDRVFLTPGTDIAVFERRSSGGRLGGKRERCLILGIGVLDGMALGQWKAILAHEYGHFVNRDTAGGGMALAVRRSLFTMALRMAKAGAAGWFNPAWWFVRGFHAAFMRVSQGASRLQEILADRWAASAYGSAAFVGGLTHVISASVRFDAATEWTLNQALKSRAPVTNLYQHPAELEPDLRRTIDAAIETALASEPDPLDSHPSPRQRFTWAQRVAAAADPVPGDERGVWELLDEREALETAMTAAVRTAVEETHGVKFADPLSDPGRVKPADAPH